MNMPEGKQSGRGATAQEPKHGASSESPTWDPSNFDPTPGTQGPRYVTAEDRTRFREVLLPIAEILEAATTASANEPTPGTDAWRLWRSVEKEHVIDAMITMRYSNMSATDHLRAYVALVDGEETGASVLATVARGTHEALARTWFLLARTSDTDLHHRSISLLIAELRFPVQFDESMRTRGGTAVDPVEMRKSLQAELQRLGVPTPKRIDFAGMVATMLDGVLQGGDGRDVYSTLSAVAHAQRYGIDTYILTDERGQVVDLVAPRAVVFQQVFELMAALSSTALEYIRFFSADPEATISLRMAELRATNLLRVLAAEMWPDD